MDLDTQHRDLKAGRTWSAAGVFGAVWLNWLYHLIRISLAGIFIVSGSFKLIDPQKFALIIQAYGLTPDVTHLPVAVGLALLEIAAGAGLIFDLRGSLGIITALLLLFMVIMGYGLWLGLDVDCGCFGSGDPEEEAYHSLRPALYRDAVMLAGIGYLYIWRLQHGFVRSLSHYQLNNKRSAA